jgi:hypothetical protein
MSSFCSLSSSNSLHSNINKISFFHNNNESNISKLKGQIIDSLSDYSRYQHESFFELIFSFNSIDNILEFLIIQKGQIQQESQTIYEKSLERRAKTEVEHMPEGFLSDTDSNPSQRIEIFLASCLDENEKLYKEEKTDIKLLNRIKCTFNKLIEECNSVHSDIQRVNY